MIHPLEQKLVELRRRVRPMAVLRGSFIVATVLLAALVCAGLVDYLFRIQDRGLRIIASLAVLGVCGWTVYRHVFTVFWMRFGNIDLARRVQRQFPFLGDQLVTAVEFLHTADDDPAAGSVALRRSVIARATAEAEGLDFSQTLDRRPLVRAGAVAGLAYMAVLLLLVVPNLATSESALKRLLNPFGNTPWPQATNLAIRRPVERVARGQHFEIEVIDVRGARLPPEVRIHYRLPTPEGGTIEETERMRIAGGVAAAKRDGVLRPFSFRIEGGDDQSSIPWTDVDVVEPPAVESLSIRLTPPAYTGERAAPSERFIRAIVRTRVQFTGKATKPLASAELCFEDGRKILAELNEDGDTFSAACSVEKSGAYWFALTDREGLHGGGDDRWEIRAIADARPSVQIEQPRADLFVTPQAVAPLRISAKDDLALRDVAIIFRRAESEPESSLRLFSGPARPPQQPEANPPGDSRVVDYRWSLAPLSLQAGMQVTFYATASDYVPQTAKSEPRRLIVVTPDELRDRLADRERLIVAELERALRMQRDCRDQVESARIRLGDLRRFEQLDVDRLQAAEHAQREVNELLARRGEGVPVRIASLLADLENNGIDNADARQRMNGLLEELDRLNGEVLPPLGRELTAAVKTAQVAREGQGGAASIAIAAKSLAIAAERQDAIIAALERQIRRLGHWDSYRRLHRDVAQLLRDQEDAAHRTSEVGRRTLTRDLRDLVPQDVADLHAAAARQLELARLLDRILQEAEQGVVELRKSDPLVADFVADALEEARRLAISGQMRDAGAEIGQNQIGQAAAAQKQIAQDLQQVLDVLANRHENELDRLVKKLRGVEVDLAALKQRQEELQKQIAANANEKDKEAADRQLQRLGQSQQQLRQETERLARQLARLQAEQAAEAAALAAKQMDEAGQRAGQGSGGDAARKAAEARRSLAEARRQLADQLRKSAAELAQEQVARLQDNVNHLRRQQENALDEAQRLHGLEQSQGQLTRSQALSVHELARLQRSLQTDAAGHGQQLAAAAAFQLALAGAADDMGQAADSLDRRETGPPTQEPQRNALRRLDQLVEALKPEPPAEPKADQDSAPGGGDNGDKKQGPFGDGIPPIAELKLLKLMQEEINSHIETLQQKAADKPTPEQLRQYVALSRQQGQLADIVLRLAPPAERNAAPQPQPPQVKPTYIAMVDEDQLKRELGTAAEKESDNPILQIAREMTEAKQRIAKADSGTGTQQLQRQIVDDLDRLIQQARKKACQCKPGQCQSQPSERKQPPRQPPKPNSKPGKNPNNKPTAPGSPRPPGKNAAKKSDAAAETRDAMQRLWYLLPQHAREQMLQSPGEEFAPKYELQIEEYFRRLSQEKRGP
jgi:hypothetical protein